MSIKTLQHELEAGGFFSFLFGENYNEIESYGDVTIGQKYALYEYKQFLQYAKTYYQGNNINHGVDDRIFAYKYVLENDELELVKIKKYFKGFKKGKVIGVFKYKVTYNRSGDIYTYEHDLTKLNDKMYINDVDSTADTTKLDKNIILLSYNEYKLHKERLKMNQPD